MPKTTTAFSGNLRNKIPSVKGGILPSPGAANYKLDSIRLNGEVSNFNGSFS